MKAGPEVIELGEDSSGGLDSAALAEALAGAAGRRIGVCIEAYQNFLKERSLKVP